MTVRLRPHHLLCILTYVGKGYSPAFTANMTAIAGRLAAGETIEIVEGPDDICGPLLDDAEPHCHWPGVAERDLRAAEDLGQLMGASMRPASRLILEKHHLLRLRAAFSTGRVRSACGSCEWHELCSAISDGEYDGAKLRQP
jgi:hypothetical protein